MSSEDESSNGTDSTTRKPTLVARRLARIVLSVAESQNTIIGRARLQKITKEICESEEYGTVKFSQVFEELNVILTGVYGFALEPLPARMGGTAHPQHESSTARAQRYILLNKNEPNTSLDDFMLAQSEYTYMQAIQDGEYVGDRLGLESTNTVCNKPGNDQDQALKGLLTIIICIILFSKNNILQQELFEHLLKFGVPIDGTPIPIINMSVLELLKTLDKLEYISGYQERPDLELETVIYRIGRKTQAEFPLESLVLLIRRVMGITERQSPNLRQDIQKHIADAYPAASSNQS